MTVVERGLARCPRCVAIADYTFVESKPNVVRYEVRCTRCGECYTEVHTATAPRFATAAASVAPAVPAPPVDVRPADGPRGRRVPYWWAEARARSSASVGAAVASARRHRDWSRLLHPRSHSGSDSS